MSKLPGNRKTTRGASKSLRQWTKRRTQICAYCGQEFNAYSDTEIYCSARCGLYAQKPGIIRDMRDEWECLSEWTEDDGRYRKSRVCKMKLHQCWYCGLIYWGRGKQQTCSKKCRGKLRYLHLKRERGEYEPDVR